MPRIELTTDVQAVPETVFDACLDVDMHTESMGTSAERAVGGVTTGRLKVGDAVTWEARHFGLPWRMTVRITDYRRPHGFTDNQTSGPFGRWHHEHTFTQNPANSSATVMRDVIDFTAPMGRLGHLVASVILRPYLQRLIARRNAYLAATLARHPRPADDEAGAEMPGDEEQPVFADPWWDLRRDGATEQRQREALHAQLLTEVAPGHPLHNQPVEVVARSEASDDIVVERAVGGWAVVHLTWKRAAERPPWPSTTFYDTVEALEEGIHEPE